MKLRNIVIISLFLLMLSIPVSFAANDIHYDNSTNLSSSLGVDSINGLNDGYNQDSIAGAHDESENMAKGNLSENSLSSNSLNSSQVSSSIYLSSEGVRLADLNDSFAQFNTSISDSNTIYVNSSYSGTEELGTKLNPYKTISGGINAVNSTLTNVFIANGIYNISETVYISQSMNIIGESLSVISDGLNRNVIFSVYGASTELSIFNITFRNAYANKGGAIYNYQGSLNIVGASFENNTAYVMGGTGYAGAIYNDAGFLKLYNASFINNKLVAGSNEVSEAYGGAIYNEHGELTILNSRFYNNSIDIRNISRTSYAAGGAIFSRAGFITIFNSTLDSNSIYTNYSLGGAVSIWASRNVYVLNSTIKNNVISGNYGFASAISNKGTLLQIENSTITNNQINASSVENSTVYNIAGNYKNINSKLENNTIKKIINNQLLCLEDQIVVSDAFDDYNNILNELNLNNIPSSYDLRQEGLITSVKNQGSSGACWTFAFLAAMESYLLKYENISYDFSENNMKNLMGDGGENSTDWDDGGNYVVALAYLLRWSGPVNESDDPFNARSMDSPHNLTPLKYLTDVAYIPLRLGYLDNDQIKLAILKYGALFAPIYSGILRSGASSYSNIQSLDNHAISIVGWDDNYSASNFRETPPGDGAFIIKNSWGSNSGDGGYYYVSYYDASFMASIETCSAVAVTGIANITEYRNNYQYDIFGNTFESVGYNSNTIWFANQFTAESNNPLNAFGFYTYGQSTYTVNITVNGQSVYVSNGSVDCAGYHTIKLSKYLPLKKGDIFKIAVKLTTPSSLFPLAIETNYSGYTPRAKSNLNQSFVSPDGNNWYDIANVSNTRTLKFYEDMYGYSIKNASVCLKAYIAFFEDLDLNVSSNESIYYTGDIIKLNLTLSNNGDASSENINAFIDLKDYGEISSYNIIIDLNDNNNYENYSYFDLESDNWHIDYLKPNESINLELDLIINADYDFTSQIYLNSFSNIEELINETFTLKYMVPTKFLNIYDITTKNLGVLNFTLSDINNNSLSNRNIILSLINSNNNYSLSNKSLMTNDDGIAEFEYRLDSGYYNFNIKFYGDNLYTSSEMNFTLEIFSDKFTQIMINANDTIKGEDIFLEFDLLDSDGNLIEIDDIFNVYIYNNDFKIALEGNQSLSMFSGKTNLTVNNIVGNDISDFIIIHAVYGGNDNYELYNMEFLPSEYFKVINVIEKDNSAKISLNCSEDSNLIIINLTKDDESIAYADLLIYVNGVESNVQTDDKGIAFVPMKSNATVEVKYQNTDGNFSYASLVYVLVNNVTEKIINNTIIEYINQTVEVPIYFVPNGTISLTTVDGSSVTAILADIEGNLIANAKLLVSINGKEYEYITSNEGKVDIPTSGKSTVVVSYTDLNNLTTTSSMGVFIINNVVEKTIIQYVNQTIEVPVIVNNTIEVPVIVNNTIEIPIILNRTETQFKYENMVTTAVNVAFDGRVGEYFYVTLKDVSGNALYGKNIQIGFNGKVYNRTTDDDGSARLQINLARDGLYTFAIGFLGDDNFTGAFSVAKITVNKQKPKLTTSNKSYKSSAKTKTLTATFKTALNNPIKGKIITFTVNGKTYSAKTNDKGLASVKVSLSKKGTYSFIVKYGGDDVFASISKNAKLTIN